MAVHGRRMPAPCDCPGRLLGRAGMQQDKNGQDDNPYRAPQAPAWPPQIPAAGPHAWPVWRDGQDVLAMQGQPFPARCVRCNAPIALPARPRKFYWHSPRLYLLILLHLVIYLIVALIVRKRSEHRVGLCPAHAQRRRGFLALAWSSPLAGLLAGVLVGMAFGSGPGALVGPVVVLVLLVVGVRGARILVPVRMGGSMARYRGTGEAFRQSLPAADGRDC